MDILIVVDMQNDFIGESLKNQAAQAIVAKVAQKIREFDGKIVFTRDTHYQNYLETQEGKNLPVEHCIINTHGWEIDEAVMSSAKDKDYEIIDKPSFGFTGWNLGNANSIELCGVCTDICVVSNALILKALYPQIPISVDSSCCAGVTSESHSAALLTMKMCQVQVK